MIHTIYYIKLYKKETLKTKGNALYHYMLFFILKYSYNPKKNKWLIKM